MPEHDLVQLLEDFWLLSRIYQMVLRVFLYASRYLIMGIWILIGVICSLFNLKLDIHMIGMF